VFFRWYNTVHRHSGIAMMTPPTVHHGHDRQLTEERGLTLMRLHTRLSSSHFRFPFSPTARGNRNGNRTSNSVKTSPSNIVSALSVSEPTTGIVRLRQLRKFRLSSHVTRMHGMCQDFGQYNQVIVNGLCSQLLFAFSVANPINVTLNLWVVDVLAMGMAEVFNQRTVINGLVIVESALTVFTTVNAALVHLEQGFRNRLEVGRVHQGFTFGLLE
jgi:hypothetical protein